jgi:serine/threonine-protein kinase
MRQIGPYKLARVLGAGGMGQVFQAIDSRTGQTVALKVIKERQAANEAARMRFVQEARAARQLQHPNIVAIHDFGQSRGALYIVMEYLAGLPLTSFIPGPPALSFRRKLFIMAQCAEALGYAHSRGVVHRDVKPANMIILADKSPKVVDFGLAELIYLPNSKVNGGTPPYMSPEQIAPRDVDGRTDIWSAGVTLFELLTGRLPYRSMAEIVSGPPPTLPQDFPFAVDLNAVLARALAKDREMRYANAEQFAADLRALRQKYEQAQLAARAAAASAHGILGPKGQTPSSEETVALPPLMLVAGEAAVSPPPVESPQASPPHQPAPVSSPGNYVLSELGFQCPAGGDLETRVGRFEWNDRANALRAWRDRLWDKAQLPRWLLADLAVSAIWICVLALLPRMSSDARNFLIGAGLMGIFTGSLLLLSLAWLALTVCRRVCPAFGVPKHLPPCRGCRLRMRLTGIWTRVCSSREEVFFGYHDCMAALKHRLWQEAAKLLSLYGEEHLSKYRERFISATIRYHISFFECRSCGHHAARLTSDEMIEKRWEEQARFEESYWGSAATTVSMPPAATRSRSYVGMAPEVMKNLIHLRLDRPVLTVVGVVVLALVSWVVMAGSGRPPVSRRISAVAFSNDARWLAAGTAQGRISVWDMTSGASRQIAFAPGVLNDLQFSPAGDLLAIASRDLGLYGPAKASATRLLRADHKNYRSVRFSRDGQTLLVVTGFGTIETLDAHSGALQIKVCCSSILGEVGEAAFTPDGEAIVNAGAWPGLWNARSGQFLGRLPTDRLSPTFRPIAFDAPRGLIVMGSSFGVWAWDWKKRRLLDAVQSLPVGNVDTLTVSQAGSVIFAGRMVARWTETGQILLWSAARPTSNLVLSPDGASLIFGTANGEIEFWDMGTARLIRTMKIPEE